MLTWMTRTLSVLRMTHALTRAHHSGTPGTRSHAWMLTWASWLMLTGVTWRLSVLRMTHALSRTTRTRAHAWMLAHWHPHSDIVH